MLRQPGRVASSHAAEVWVDCEADPGCARCAAGRGCGAGLAMWTLGNRRARVHARNPARIDLQAGEPVEIAISERALLGAALVAYGVPLAGLVLGALAGAGLAGDAGAAAGLLLGLGAAFGLARLLAGRAAARLEPVVCRRRG